MVETWTFEVVEFRVREAARSLGRLPDVDARFRRARSVMWPDYLQEKHLAYGRTKVSARPPLPQSGDISDMDEVIGWFGHYLHVDMVPPGARLPPDTGRIVWLHAWGLSWGKIMEIRNQIYGYDGGATKGKAQCPGGNSRMTLRRFYNDGLGIITDGLNDDGVLPARF